MTTMADLEKYKERYKLVYDEYVAQNIHSILPEYVEGRRVLDIGANVGFVSLYFLAIGAKNTIAFEPNPPTFKLLQETAAGHDILPINAAVLNGLAKTVKMTSEENNNLGIAKSVPDSTGVEAWSLHQALSLFPEDDNNLVLKVDTEGSEYDIMLYASARDIRRAKTVFLETHQVPHLTPMAARHSDYLRDYMIFLGYTMLNEQMVCWIENGNYSQVPENKAMTFSRIDDWKG